MASFSRSGVAFHSSSATGRLAATAVLEHQILAAGPQLLGRARSRRCGRRGAQCRAPAGRSARPWRSPACVSQDLLTCRNRPSRPTTASMSKDSAKRRSRSWSSRRRLAPRRSRNSIRRPPAARRARQRSSRGLRDAPSDTGPADLRPCMLIMPTTGGAWGPRHFPQGTEPAGLGVLDRLHQGRRQGVTGQERPGGRRGGAGKRAVPLEVRAPAQAPVLGGLIPLPLEPGLRQDRLQFAKLARHVLPLPSPSLRVHRVIACGTP